MDKPPRPELELLAQAQRWGLHINQTPLAVIEWDMDGRVRSWNPAAERMFGYTAAEAIGQPIIELIVPPKTEVLEQVHHLAEGLTQQGRLSQAEHENRRKDGSLILCRWFNTPLTDEAGQPLGVASMALDVTEIQRATQALMESEQRFRIAADFTHDWEYWIAQNGSIPWMSPSCEHITGYSVADFQLDPDLIYRICHPDDRAMVMDHVHEALGEHGVHPIEFRIRHRDGHQIWISHICAPVWDDLGTPAGRRATNQDITDRKRAEETIRKVSTAVEQSPVSIVITDIQGAIEYVNPMFTKVTGYSLAEVLGQNPRILKSGDKTPEFYKALWDTLLSGEIWQGEFRNKKKNGELFWEQASISPIRNDRGIITSFVAVKEDITERKKGEAALREAHQFNEMIISSVQEGLVVFDLNLRYLVWNPFMEGMTGVRASDVLGKHPLEVFPFLRAEGVVECFEKALNGETVGPIDAPYRVPGTGKSGWITRVCSPLRNSKGEIIGVIGTVSDITERKRSESAQQETEQRFRTIFEKAIDGIVMFSTDGKILDMNEAYAQMHGYAREDMLGLNLKNTDTPESAKLAPERMGRMVAGEVLQVELEQIHKDGHVYFVEATASLISFAGRPVILSFHRDITERKKAEDALRESERLLRESQRVARLGSYVFDVPAGSFASSRMLDGIFGIDEKYERSLEGWIALIHPDWQETMTEYIRQDVLGNRQGFDREYKIIRQDSGEERWVHGLGQLETDGEDHPIKLIGIIRDITDQKRAEEEGLKLQAQLQQAQKMESLGALAGGVAHDMNNVLGAILGLASAHIGTQPYGTPLHQALDTICKATERGGKMVKGLLSFARQSPAENHELDMNAILKEQVGLLERTTLAKIRLQVDLETDLRPMRGDASALNNALMNLCVNAVDAMPENGTLTLHTRNVDNDWIEVVVEDTGTGMPKEILEKALDPFFTTKGVGKGTGLGLSMVHSTVKAHRGQMAIQSEPGQGTRVMLRFPACENEIQVVAPAVSQATFTPHGTLKMLVVDDDELIQGSMQAILEVMGHTVATASTGEDALEKLEAGLQPDVVILDMNMPGLGGAGTLPRLRGLRPKVPVLLCTGRADQTALDLASAHPGVTLLSKPFGLRELQKHLEDIGLG